MQDPIDTTGGTEPEWTPLEVALFPIPDVVAFPGVDLPLHVFEPRYRTLVHDCIEHNRMIGVCHTVKPISRPRNNTKTHNGQPPTLEETLSTNQTTYQPHPVFSAGHCEILETTTDGRLLASVSMSDRLLLIDEVQSLPYRIVSCRPLEDAPAANDSDLGALQIAIHQRLIKIVESQQPGLARDLTDPSWLQLSPTEYSFRIFQCLRFEADLMQVILETTSAQERLGIVDSMLSSA